MTPVAQTTELERAGEGERRRASGLEAELCGADSGGAES